MEDTESNNDNSSGKPNAISSSPFPASPPIRVLGIDPGYKNLALCMFEKSNSCVQILRWSLVNLFPDMEKPAAKKNPKQKRKKTPKPTVFDMVQRLQAYLVAEKWEEGVQLIAIENQPGGPKGNNTSKCLSHSLQTYMIHFSDPDSTIGFVHPTTKRSFFSKDLKDTIEKIRDSKKRYDKTKIGAEDIVNQFLDGEARLPHGWPAIKISKTLRDYFQLANKKKQDDLADSFLLGLLLLRKHEIKNQPKAASKKKRRKRKKQPAAAPTNEPAQPTGKKKRKEAAKQDQELYSIFTRTMANPTIP